MVQNTKLNILLDLLSGWPFSPHLVVVDENVIQNLINKKDRHNWVNNSFMTLKPIL